MNLPTWVVTKNQAIQQQKQASHAISIFYEIVQSNYDKKISSVKKILIPSTEKEDLKSTHVKWKSVYNDLYSEIKIRHYSTKTLKAYTGWVRQFQSVSQGKDPQLLSASDVKDFLTFLAVKRKVSALTQNQDYAG